MTKRLDTFSATFDGDFFTDSLRKKLYATDASVYRKIPMAVAYPKSTRGIQQLISLAEELQVGLIPRAAGTSLAGQCVGDGIIVDVSRYFTEVLHLDKGKKQVRVQPGVIRDELNTYLAAYELFFGPNTSTSNRCMIGGMVGNNSSGTTSIQYGVTRDKVVSLKAVLSNGEEVFFSNVKSDALQSVRNASTLESTVYDFLYKQLSQPEIQQEIRKEFPKNGIHRRNTGYAIDALLETDPFTGNGVPFNLSKLFCGSEGTLGFITEITLQLDDMPPPYSSMVVAEYDQMHACMKDVVVAMKHPLFTCELMDEVIIDCTKNNKTYEAYRFFLQGTPKAVLMLELRANSEKELQQLEKSLLDDLKTSNLSQSQLVLRGDEIQMALELRKAGLGLLGNMVGDRKAVACIEDTAVAVSDLPNYISEFDALMESHKQQAVYYAHAGAGELHLRPILDLKKSLDVQAFRAITSDVAKLIKKYHGSLSGEHGDGIVRAEFLESQVGSKNFQLLRDIKKCFDPNNIFNPGKITDAWPMDASLRYESDREEPEVTTRMDFSDSEGILRLAEKCNGSGDCRKTEKSSGMLCPSYHATKDEKDSTRGRANVLREVITHPSDTNRFNNAALKEAFDLCVSCKACATECPSNVDMATAKAEFQYQYHKSNPMDWSQHFFGKSSSYYQWASKFPKLSNRLITSRLGTFFKKWTGIAENRSLPTFSNALLLSKLKNGQVYGKASLGKVFLFVDEFSKYLEAEIAWDAIELLTGVGYEVEVVSNLDSARAMISKGYLDAAKKEVDRNLRYLKDHISAITPLLGIEPSAILGFRDEYPRLATDSQQAKALQEHVFLIEEFLVEEFNRGTFDTAIFTKDTKQIKIHVHCHQKSLSTSKYAFDFLNIPENYHPVLIPSGCCGMAGSFGYEKEHYDVSMKIGETKLFPSIRKTPDTVLLAANGTSCRHQIKDGTARTAHHPISLLRNALCELPIF